MSTPSTERRWFAAARELPSGQAPEVAAARSFAWVRPASRERVAAWGAVETMHGDPQRDPTGLEAVAAREVVWATSRPPVPGPWWGGFAFDADSPRDQAWSGFGVARWTLPELAIVEKDGRAWAIAVAESAAEATSRLEALRLLPATAAPPSGTGVRVVSMREDRTGWTALVEGADASFMSGAFEKVVAARPIDIELSARADAERVTSALAGLHPSCTTFFVPSRESASFFAGATPETLVRIEQGRVFVDALAGTVPPGIEPGDKELREHRFVVDMIVGALRPLAQAIEAPAQPERLELRNLVHLKTPIAATLRPSSSIAEVVAALHPTPAVCGTPRDAAKEWIRQHEGFDRGWYAGAVGWACESGAHLCVALRSALFDGSRARLFVGAGLVRGSSPAAEWDETSRKASAVLDALGGRP